MRQTKFRAWDSEKRVMVYVRDNRSIQLFDDGSGSIVFHNGIADHVMVKLNRLNLIMQFTGLKDKNGKEIYEGDIVQGFYGGAPKYSPDVIEFTNGYFGLRKIGLSIHDWLEYDGVYVADLEIIGNVYENPELLNGIPKDKPSVATMPNSKENDHSISSNPPPDE